MDTPAKVRAPETQATTMYHRQSSGLVREASPTDTLIYNIMFTSPGLAIALLYLYQPSFYPGINMYISLGIGAGIGLSTVVVFGMLSAAIPRSGADYAWVTRILTPALGVMSSVGFTLLWLIFAGFQSKLFADTGLTPMFRQIGIATQSHVLINIGNWFSTDLGGFVAGGVAIATIIAVFAFAGLRTWFRIQNGMFVVAMIGLVVVAVAMLATSLTGLTSSINHAFAWSTGNHHSVASLRVSAAKAGYATGPFNLRNTLLGMTWVYASFLFGISSTWIGSEVRAAERVQLWTVPAATLFTTAWGFLFIFLFARIHAINLVGAIGFVNGGQVFGSAPTFAELASYTVPVVFSVVIGIAFALWPLVVLPNLLLNASRNMFAYGLDGLLPTKVSEVSIRFGTPLFNLAIVLALAILSLILYQFTSLLVTLSTFLVFVFGFMVVSITAIVFPLRQRDLFESSPIRWRVGGIPVISILGVISLAYNGFFIWVFLEDPTSGIAGNTRMILTNVGIILSGLVLYGLASAYWRSRGRDLSATYKELPVE